MKKYSTQIKLFAGLLLGSALTASAVPVTFQVGMGYQQTIGNFNPATDTVEARGSFQGWSGGFTLTNVPSTTIYQGTYDVAGSVGSTNYFKFVIVKSGGDQWEGVSDRPFTLTGSPQTLPLLYWNDLPGPPPPVEVTFSVDMTVQLTNGSGFYYGGLVEARGSFQSPDSWTGGFTLTNNPSGATPNIHSGTYLITNTMPGSTISYKFWAVGPTWETDPNRTFTMPSVATNLPVEYFNRMAPGTLPVPVKFQVDMSVQTLVGAFDPSADTVQARGSFQTPQTWTGGFNLTNDPVNTNLYVGVYDDPHAPGTYEEYKFVILKADDPDPNSWAHGESRNNRSFTLATNSQTLPIVFFDDNRGNTNDYLSLDTAVTFSVSMTNAVLYPSGTPFDPTIMNGVYINGDFLGWWTWTGTPPGADQLTNAPGINQIYSQTLVLPKGTNRKLVYKYGVDYYPTMATVDNEMGFATNHVRYIRSTLGSYRMPMDTFGVPVTEPEIGPLNIGPAIADYVLLTWSGWPGIRLQTSPSVSPAVWTDVAGSDGRIAMQYPVGSVPTYFRVIKP